ncbi:glycoside hydrolase family 128 protein [Plicaturopsis crispa FD-325 SS-3]|nr:glycoside hydrolase family 128 protein [Plicaturopsis crispa FD-325 SS-3]
MSTKLTKLTTITTIAIAVWTALNVAASPTSPARRAVTSSSKAGLGWPNGNVDAVSQYTSTGKVSWYYNWGSDPVSSADIEYVPMLWGSKNQDDFAATINQTIANYHVSAVLGMNEPQQAGQSNLTPDEGAQMWKTYLEPLRSLGVRLGSPAPSSAPSGLTWLQQFLTSCAGGCTVDFIVLHYYDVNATDFQRYLQSFHDAFQKPIWVTEWACQNFNDATAQCSDDEVARFLNETQTFMDETDWVERYAWFGAMEDLQGVNQADALMDKSGKITALGKQYIGAEGDGGVTVGGSLPSTRPSLLLAAMAIMSSLVLVFP